MKSEWKHSTIGEVCVKVTDGSHFSPKSVERGEYMVSVKDFTLYGFDFSSCRQISKEDYNKLAASGCVSEYEDILIGKDGARYFEDVIVYRQRERPALLSSIAILRCNKEKILPEYLYYILKTPTFKKDVKDNYGSGSAIPRIILKDFKRMPIKYPGLDEQKRVVSILTLLDQKIALNNKINENLGQQAEALYKAWFIDYLPFAGEKPEEWNNTIIEELTSLVSRGITPKYTEDSDQIVINQKCVRDHRIDLSLARTHTPKKINEKWLQYGDLLINSTGEGTLGRAAQVWFKPEKMTVDSHVTIVRPKSKELMYYIGFWGLVHEKEIESLHTGSTGQTELPRERIKAMELVLPDQTTLAIFNAIVQPMTETIINNQIQNNKLAALRDALLPKLMSGEIDVENIRV